MTGKRKYKSKRENYVTVIQSLDSNTTLKTKQLTNLPFPFLHILSFCLPFLSPPPCTPPPTLPFHPQEPKNIPFLIPLRPTLSLPHPVPYPSSPSFSAPQILLVGLGSCELTSRVWGGSRAEPQPPVHFCGVRAHEMHIVIAIFGYPYLQKK